MRKFVRSSFVRELLIVIVFCFLTSVVTWPYVTRLRDAVVGPGDPYLVTWMMWWDYHQTFADPLHLFHANVFYPYRYTLAFSETCYGLALPFFPLFVLGFRPLTVHSVAMFFGFALSGYAAFRLTRTLTGSQGAAWTAGIVFAFIPYRFNLMAQLMYLFSVWIPLLFEALVLFVRERSRKRAAWLGFAFFMTGLTTITWLLLCLIPLAVIAAILLTRHQLWSDRSFWCRSVTALGIACVALLPFTIPFYIVSRMYGFVRTVDDVKTHSASPIHWFVAEGRSKIWHGMGENFPEAWKFQMFPGLLPLLLPLPALFSGRLRTTAQRVQVRASVRRWTRCLDVLIVIAFIFSVLALGFQGTDYFGKVFHYYITSDRTLGLLFFATVARLCLAYPSFFPEGQNANLVETIRSNRRADSFWIAIVLVILGFVYSIGWNFFFYRLLYDFMPGFRSIRAPMRGAMFAYLGLAILSGLGVKRLSEIAQSHRKSLRPVIVFSLACVLLLVEMNNAPLYFIRGEVYPDQVTLRLKQTPMRGGITYFPAGIEFDQRYMLRAADHQKPLILGTSGFSPPYVTQIETMTAKGSIPFELMNLFEEIPASYLVVENQLIPTERQQDFQAFLVRALKAGRLRFINRFDGHNDLYAVTKTEPQAQSEAAVPFDTSIRDWSAVIAENQISLLTLPNNLAERLFRAQLARSGTMPRYNEFMTDVGNLCHGVIVGSDEQQQELESNFTRLLEDWTKQPVFRKTFAELDETQFVDRLLRNSGISLDASERQELISRLIDKQENRATAMLAIVDHPRFAEKEQNRSLVALHYFAYLRRNPDDPPDGDLRGFNFWLSDQERRPDVNKLSSAFRQAWEYEKLIKQH